MKERARPSPLRFPFPSLPPLSTFTSSPQEGPPVDSQEGECEDRWSQLAETEPAALHPAATTAATNAATNGEGSQLERGVAGRTLPSEPCAGSARHDGAAHRNGNGNAAHGNGNAANGYGNGDAAANDAAANDAAADDDAATTPLYGEQDVLCAWLLGTLVLLAALYQPLATS